MNLHLKIWSFLTCFMFVELCFIRNSFSIKISRGAPQVSGVTDVPNGPVDLPTERKLNLGLRKYQHANPPQEDGDSEIETEMKEDADELKDITNKAKFPYPQSENIYIKHQENYDIPPWLAEMINLSSISKHTLESLGVENLPDVDACRAVQNLKEQMLCILDALEDIKRVYQDAKDITSLTARVLAGGRLAVRALSRLKTLASAFENRHLMKKLGTPMATLIMLQRESTSDRNRWLCGSILTLLTDLPVVSDLADIKTGSYGHVNVIMPRQSRVRNSDRHILKMREGAAPSSLIGGYTAVEGGYTI
ncbi:conserved Plasmodium protein, unknown function [Plasmodium knowlesi strain H]|uniref:Uncharacterized protein n=3 Tax=Plasmodium knowlesi TaxID=5850 RepID=A0A1A7VDG0_PLAKH|nr:conserved protein, unknown function [Plasmodium knowlesi strain H]OTN65246.1 Uncharacterized protein PKNOH_S120131000 [Plasmodium knowlesi]CAA9988173.1 conserved protein, unknown function [Plasmodium knowlesi strain H]SBO20083.1 conserved Plasmodium protein, unknown function [Plasmodium knowlesi strain H]SBO20716.1 conserved Plasmodium protein, unknown function [Plasmodium knowlesi strain H]VVS77647.1 conserved protein, unknown function [Plasmodium knowlesi strain H]